MLDPLIPRGSRGPCQTGQDSELSALLLTPLIKVGWPWMGNSPIVWLEIGNDFMVDQAKSVHEIIYIIYVIIIHVYDICEMIMELKQHNN